MRLWVHDPDGQLSDPPRVLYADRNDPVTINRPAQNGDQP
jgi:hypothetical protein